MKHDLSHITEEDVKQWASKQPRSTPNPIVRMGISGLACAYNGDDGTHCIVGQFLADQGVTIPSRLNVGTSVETVNERLQLRLQPDVVSLLQQLQRAADDATRERYKEPWGWAIDAICSNELQPQ